MKKRTASQNGRRSRAKGAAFEREVAIIFRNVFPDARRRLENHKDDANGVDLMNTGRFKIQCKKLKDWAPVGRIKEITLEEGDIPVLITAGDNKPAMAVLPLEDFMDLVGMFYQMKAGA